MKDACLSVGPVCLSSLSQGKWGAKSSSSMPETAWNLTPRASLCPHSSPASRYCPEWSFWGPQRFGVRPTVTQLGRGRARRGCQGWRWLPNSVSAEGLPGWACQGPQSWHSQGPCHQHSPPRPQHPRQLPGDREAMPPVAEQRFCPDYKWATSATVRWGPRLSPALATQLGQWVQGNNQGFWSQTDLGSVSF